MDQIFTRNTPKVKGPPPQQFGKCTTKVTKPLFAQRCVLKFPFVIWGGLVDETWDVSAVTLVEIDQSDVECIQRVTDAMLSNVTAPVRFHVTKRFRFSGREGVPHEPGPDSRTGSWLASPTLRFLRASHDFLIGRCQNRNQHPGHLPTQRLSLQLYFGTFIASLERRDASARRLSTTL